MILDGKVVKDGQRTFAQVDGVWTGNEKAVKQFILESASRAMIRISKWDEKKEEFIIMPFSSKGSNARAIADVAKQFFPINHKFSRDIVLQSEGKIAFMDGYWEFVDTKQDNGKYGRFHPGELYPTMTMIRREFPIRVEADIKFVYDNIIDPPFLHTDYKTLFLRAIARALAGRLDKVTNFLVGTRNSSKSVLMQFVRHAVEGYSCACEAGCLVIGASGLGSDPYRQNSFVMAMEHARIAVISEGKQTSTKAAVYSGEQLKRIQSMKEGLMARGNYQDEAEYYSLATAFLCMNDVPTFSPVDAMERCHIYTLPNKFMSKTEKETEENRYNTTCMLADDKINSLIRDPRYTAAFLHIIFDHYSPEPIIVTHDMKEFQADMMEETGDDIYERYFEVTLLNSDRVAKGFAEKFMREKGNDVGIYKMNAAILKLINKERELRGVGGKLALADINCLTMKSPRQRSWKYIKIRSGNQVDMDDGGMASGFHP